MKTVVLKDICGEFATERKQASLCTALIQELFQAIQKQEKIIVERQGVKIMSLSFFDQILAELKALGVKGDSFHKFVQFTPALEEFYLKQIPRRMD